MFELAFQQEECGIKCGKAVNISGCNHRQGFKAVIEFLSLTRQRSLQLMWGCGASQHFYFLKDDSSSKRATSAKPLTLTTHHWHVSKRPIPGSLMTSWWLVFKELFVSALCLGYEWHAWDGGTALRAAVITTQHRLLVHHLACCVCASSFPLGEYGDKEPWPGEVTAPGKWIATVGFDSDFVMWEGGSNLFGPWAVDWTLWLMAPLWKKYLKITAKQK